MRIPAFLLYKKAPENSVAFRVATLCSVMCGILAILHEQQWPPFSWVVVGATTFGFWLSYVRRDMTNWVIKIFLSLFMLVALWDFLINLYYSPFDPRVPLANLLLWLQLLHSFDLPARRDLNYSLTTGFILISVAAVLSHDMTYVPFLAAFLVCGLYTLLYNYLSQAADGRKAVTPMPPFAVLTRCVIALTTTLTLVGGVLFFFIPRGQGMKIRPLPMTLQLNVPRSGKGELRNPAYPQMSGRVTPAQRRFDPDSYFGFNAYLDLNIRGKLSDEIVMRVRSSEETYYRGLAFNHYNGTGWEIRQENLQQVISPSPPIMLNIDGVGEKEIVQIFYIEKDMPNIIFSAYHLEQLFFPSDTVYVDSHGGVRTAFPLETGMVYSVISKSRPPRPAVMRRLAQRAKLVTNLERRAAALDLNLPTTVPSRVKALAEEITRGKIGNYEKAEAITNYLQTRYEYSLDIPPFDDSKDVTDEFLFNYRRGYCEQFATALAVMCREIGIPARLVTGYLPGTYNPFTGYYEVKSADAHAWVEVMVDRFGWVEFDASPGYSGTPQAPTPAQSGWVFDSLVKYLKDRLGLQATDMASLGRALVARLMAYVERAGVLGWVAFGAVTCSLAALVLLALARLGRRGVQRVGGAAGMRLLVKRLGGGIARRLNQRGETRTPSGEVAVAWHQMVELLTREGCPRTIGQTPSEYAQAAAEHVPLAREPIDVLTEAFENARYGPRPVEASEVDRARQALAAVRERMAKKG